ncbi:MAG TPA: RNA methyltransferase [Thermoanaerobaculia bacterium]|jgi:TrmH family RNA methyltransferase|nr:RNA methyltransferase [Thermoanaerobaculia bacterium]
MDETQRRVAVVLVHPREEGNVGSAARAMANMGLSEMILVEPAAAFGPVATAFAVGARHVLENARRVPDLPTALAPFRRVVGTTSIRDRRWEVPLLTPRELPAQLAADPPDTPTALVFGPEVGGLTNDDLALASLIVTIPCSPVQPTLNLSQAVLILAYELFQAAGQPPLPKGTVGSPEPPAATAEIDGLFTHAAEVLERAGFARDSSFPGVLRDLRRLTARAAPTSREVAILRGICRRTLQTLRALERSPGEV